MDGYDFTAEINQIEKKSKKNESSRSNPRKQQQDEEEKELEQDGCDDISPGSPAHRLLDFQIKHRTARSKWSVPESFPDALIANAYLQPKANYDTDKFEWTLPQVIHVRNYCRDKLGWSEAQVVEQATKHTFLEINALIPSLYTRWTPLWIQQSRTFLSAQCR